MNNLNPTNSNPISEKPKSNNDKLPRIEHEKKIIQSVEQVDSDSGKVFKSI